MFDFIKLELIINVIIDVFGCVWSPDQQSAALGISSLGSRVFTVLNDPAHKQRQSCVHSAQSSCTFILVVEHRKISYRRRNNVCQIKQDVDVLLFFLFTFVITVFEVVSVSDMMSTAPPPSKHLYIQSLKSNTPSRIRPRPPQKQTSSLNTETSLHLPGRETKRSGEQSRD